MLTFVLGGDCLAAAVCFVKIVVTSHTSYMYRLEQLTAVFFVARYIPLPPGERMPNSPL